MSSTPSPTDSPVILPMHNPSQAAVVQPPQAPLGNSTNGLLHPPGQGTKAMLAKRMATKGGNPKYVSPTDNMLTPCTAKIGQSKKKHFNKGKPVQLFMKEKADPKLSDDETTQHIPGEESQPEEMKVDDNENPF